MAEYRTDEEQVELLKKWWKENGTFTVIMVVVMLVAVMGWRGYQDRKSGSLEKASETLFDMVVATAEKKTEQAEKLGRQLITEHDGSLQATQAALILAKYEVDRGEYDKALLLLKPVRENAVLPTLRNLASLRMGRIYFQQGKLDEGLSVLKVENAGKLGPMIEELRGDLYAAKGDVASARQSYQNAIDKDPVSFRSGTVRMKMEDLSEAKPAPKPAAKTG